MKPDPTLSLDSKKRKLKRKAPIDPREKNPVKFNNMAEKIINEYKFAAALSNHRHIAAEIVFEKLDAKLKKKYIHYIYKKDCGRERIEMPALILALHCDGDIFKWMLQDADPLNEEVFNSDFMYFFIDSASASYFEKRFSRSLEHIELLFSRKDIIQKVINWSRVSKLIKYIIDKTTIPDHALDSLLLILLTRGYSLCPKEQFGKMKSAIFSRNLPKLTIFLMEKNQLEMDRSSFLKTFDHYLRELQGKERDKCLKHDPDLLQKFSSEFKKLIKVVLTNNPLFITPQDVFSIFRKIIFIQYKKRYVTELSACLEALFTSDFKPHNMNQLFRINWERIQLALKEQLKSGHPDFNNMNKHGLTALEVFLTKNPDLELKLEAKFFWIYVVQKAIQHQHRLIQVLYKKGFELDTVIDGLGYRCSDVLHLVKVNAIASNDVSAAFFEKDLSLQQAVNSSQFFNIFSINLAHIVIVQILISVVGYRLNLFGGFPQFSLYEKFLSLRSDELFEGDIFGINGLDLLRCIPLANVAYGEESIWELKLLEPVFHHFGNGSIDDKTPTVSYNELRMFRHFLELANKRNKKIYEERIASVIKEITHTTDKCFDDFSKIINDYRDDFALAAEERKTCEVTLSDVSSMKPYAFNFIQKSQLELIINISDKILNTPTCLKQTERLSILLNELRNNKNQLAEKLQVFSGDLRIFKISAELMETKLREFREFNDLIEKNLRGICKFYEYLLPSFEGLNISFLLDFRSPATLSQLKSFSEQVDDPGKRKWAIGLQSRRVSPREPGRPGSTTSLSVVPSIARSVVPTAAVILGLPEAVVVPGPSIISVETPAVLPTSSAPSRPVLSSSAITAPPRPAGEVLQYPKSRDSFPQWLGMSSSELMELHKKSPHFFEISPPPSHLQPRAPWLCGLQSICTSPALDSSHFRVPTPTSTMLPKPSFFAPPLPISKPCVIPKPHVLPLATRPSALWKLTDRKEQKPAEHELLKQVKKALRARLDMEFDNLGKSPKVVSLNKKEWGSIYSSVTLLTRLIVQASSLERMEEILDEPVRLSAEQEDNYARFFHCGKIWPQWKKLLKDEFLQITGRKEISSDEEEESDDESEESDDENDMSGDAMSSWLDIRR